MMLYIPVPCPSARLKLCSAQHPDTGFVCHDLRATAGAASGVKVVFRIQGLGEVQVAKYKSIQLGLPAYTRLTILI